MQGTCKLEGVGNKLVHIKRFRGNNNTFICLEFVYILRIRGPEKSLFSYRAIINTIFVMVQLCGESNLKLDERRCFFAKQSKLAHGLNLKMSKNDLSALQAKNVSCFQNFRKYIFLTKLNTILVVIHTDMPLLHLKQIKKKTSTSTSALNRPKLRVLASSI